MTFEPIEECLSCVAIWIDEITTDLPGDRSEVTHYSRSRPEPYLVVNPKTSRWQRLAKHQDPATDRG